MKGKQLLGSGVAAALVLVLMAGLALAQGPEETRLGTATTYQGRLKSSEVPYTGDCDFKFGLWDALENGKQVGTLTKNSFIDGPTGGRQQALDGGINVA